MLSADERRALLRLTRGALAAAVRGESPAGAPDESPAMAPGESPAAGSAGGDPSGRLGQPGGAFVTLRLNGRLRGCIGHIETPDPLVETIRRVAALAATADPRFGPVTAAELPLIDVEISVLGTPSEPDDPTRLEIGRHGVLVDDGARRALLLPQVAVEWGWSARRFLREACRKAGLGADAWRRGARVQLFEAEVFGDSDDDPNVH